MGITYSSPRITITGGNDTGTATSGAVGSLTNTGKSWTTNAYAGRAVWIHTGTGAGQLRRIASNTATVLTVSHNFTTAPDSTSQYVVLYNIADVQVASTAGAWGVVTTTGTQIKIAADLVIGDGSTKSGLFDYAKELWLSVPSAAISGGTAVLCDTKAAAIICFGEEDANALPLNGCRLLFDLSLSSSAGIGPSLFGSSSAGGEVRLFDSLTTVLPPTGAGSYCFVRCYDKAVMYGNTWSKHQGGRWYSANTLLRDNRFHDGTTQSFSFGATPALAEGLTFYREDKALKAFSTFSAELLSAIFKNNTYDIYLDNNAGALSGIVTLTDCLHEGSGLVADAKVYCPGPSSNSGGLKEKKRVRLIIRNSADAAIQSARIYLKNTSGTQIINTTTDASGTHTITSVEVTNRTGYPLVKTSYNPFEFRYRLYGYIFASESATINAPLIDVIKRLTTNSFVIASDATATAYTGVTISGSAKTITLSGARTVQELYDYSQAWGDDSGNVQYDEPITTADGVTFNLTTSWVLTPAGNLTYTGKRIAGGTIANGTPGTWSPRLGTTTVRFTAAGTYVMSAADITGTVTFENTSGGAVTVELDSSVTYVNSGPSITVQLPVEYQSVTINGGVSGSRLQIYDTTNSTELYNGTPTFPHTWTDTAAASTSGSRDIRVRIANVSGTTAYAFLEASIGTCGTTTATKDISYLASQSLDTTYNSNAVDGSAVTGITIVEGSTDRVQIAIAGGTVSWASIYAYQCYWLFTSTGIQDDGAFISAPDTANYILTGFKIKNTHASTPLVITGGYGVDSTGSVSALYDTTGTSIFPAPAHVVPYQTTGTYAITGDISTVLAAIPAAADNAAAVRTELTTELGRIDAAISTRLAAAGYTAPPTAADNAAATLAAAQITPIASNIEQVHTIPVTGSGTSGDPWGPA